VTAALSITVARHAVPRGPDELSPLQHRILHDPAPVRVFSAPTGAGKSHAFIKAASEGRRVLFIVPTRRLAQNLAQDAADAMAKLSPPVLDAVGIWSSDERVRQQAINPNYRPWRARLLQVQAIDTTRFIVATPESVALMLLGYASAGQGADPFGAAALNQYFDHIVFDEFHTIDPRGFGLCAFVARLCAFVATGPRVTFLSATPIGILPVLTELAVSADAISVATETVVEDPPSGDTLGLRVLHGDVRLCFVTEPDLVALLAAHEAEIRACIARGKQLVVILDSLAELHAHRAALAALFDGLGIPPARRLAVNSIDDAATGGQDGLFTADRNADPRGFDVLLTTSAIEMGVTFRAGMIVMDPGHDAGSFVQRVGRVARGDEPGLVVVRRDPAREGRRGWLRTLLLELAGEPPDRPMRVSRFLELALRSARTRFETPPGLLEADAPPAEFRAMPQRATWAACLFWYALERRRPSYARGQKDVLHQLAPGKVRTVAALLRAVQGKPGDVHFGAEWTSRFVRQAETLRDIAPSVAVKEPGRLLGKVPLAFLDRYPVLLAFPLLADEKGGWTLVLDRPLHALLAGAESTFAPKTRVVLLPDGQSRTVSVAEAAPEAIRAMQGLLAAPGTSAALASRLEAAIVLVRLSGLVPGEEAAVPAGGVGLV